MTSVGRSRHAPPLLIRWPRTPTRPPSARASDARLERHLRPALSPWLAQYTRVLHGTFTRPKVGAIDVAAMDAPAAALRAALGSARGIGAAWQDAVEASQSGHDEHLAWSLANLTS